MVRTKEAQVNVLGEIILKSFEITVDWFEAELFSEHVNFLNIAFERKRSVRNKFIFCLNLRDFSTC